MSNDTMDIIIAVLKYLEESMDDERIDFSKVNPESLKVSVPRYHRVLEMMIVKGYITGFTEVNVPGITYNQYKAMSPNITLDGIDYLGQNTPTAKAYRILKEIRDWVK